MQLSQNGSTITGTSILPPVPGASYTTNTITGSISGSAVSLTLTVGIRTAVDTTVILSTSVTRMTLQATNTTMSGSYTTTSTATCSGSQFCPAPITTNASGSVSATKQ
jgi:hypothetical protein